MGTIRVSPQFKKDFDEYCAMYQMTDAEMDDMRALIRKNFSESGEFISKFMMSYRWAIDTWNGHPSVEELVEYLDKRKASTTDMRYGVDALIMFCYELSGICIQN